MKITREEIVNTAFALFREKGFDSVRLDEVCRACGITKPTFYHYVPSKEAILTEYYDQVCQGVMLRFANVYQMESYYRQFHLFYDMIIDSSLSLGPDLVGKMVALNLQRDRHSFETRSRMTEIAMYLIRNGQKAGEFLSPLDARDLYEDINFVFLGMELKWCVKKGSFDWKAEFRRISDAVLQAVPPSAVQ